jgi:hypothetical protein
MQLLRHISLQRQAASHRDICCLSVFLRSPVPPRLRGLLSHLGAINLIMREQRRDPVSPMVWMCGCVVFVAAVLLASLYAYKLSTYQGWRAIVHKVTLHKKDSITLQAGETLVAVVEIKKGTYFFLGTKTRKGSYSE